MTTNLGSRGTFNTRFQLLDMSAEFLKTFSDMGGWTSQTCDLFFKLPNFSVEFFKKKRFLAWEAG